MTIPDLRQLQVFTVNALGEFRSEATLRCPGTPTGVRFADVNADGLIDLVTATENELIVFPGGSEQPFREPSVFAAGGVISDWVLTDVDGDDLVDAAIITTNPSKITILGNSSFHGTVDWPSTYGVGRSPRGLTTGDFNGDGRIDAGVVCSVSGTLCLLLNQGEGRMTGPIFAHVASNPISVKAVAEGKGASTTFVLSHYPSTQVTVVQRRDDFRFSSFAIPTAGNPFVLSAEIDRSRHTLSFLTTNRTDEQENISLSLFDEISEDQFIETSLQPSPSKSVTSIASFDMTGDNEMDLVFTTFERNRDQSSVSVSRGIDRSSFSPYEKVFSFPDSAGTVRFIRSAFLDSDSRPDIIAILGKPMACLLLLYGNGTGGIRDSVQWIRDVDIPDGDALIVEDLNNDGNMDLCFIDLQTQRIVALYGKGGGEFGMRKPIHSAEGIVALSVASFLTAPVKDLIISHEANGTISLVRNPF